jgi:type I restriction enzyme S subunit
MTTVNQVPQGYKQTEVGVIPEDWEQVRLGEIFSFKNGLNKEKEFFGYGTPIVNYMDVFSHPAIRASSLNGRVFLSKPEIKNFDVRKGDVFFTRTSETTEEIGIASVMLDEPTDTVFSGFVLRARPLNQQIDDEFKAYCFSSALVRKQIISKASYTTRALTNGGTLSQVLLPTPPLLEQRAIATALSDVDALLAAQDKLVAKKRDIKQAAMQQLLTGKQCLPGFTGEWEVKRLGDVAEMGSGGTPPSSVPAYYDGDIPWVSISDMTKGGKVILSTDRNLSREGFSNSAAQMFSVGTVLYAMYASLGECSIAGISLCTSQAILGIRPNDNLNKDFLYYYLTSLKNTVKSMGQQGTQANLNKGMVQAFQFRLPPIAEQTAIATILSDMDADLVALEQQRDKTRALKQGMMQALLTGKIRLISSNA